VLIDHAVDRPRKDLQADGPQAIPADAADILDNAAAAVR
jgi:hypothetical protein